MGLIDNIEVDGNHNYFVVSASNSKDGYLVHNKLVFGGTTPPTVTKYIGGLYEETNGRKTKHIYFGDMKVASVTGGHVRYHHADHLGGANVLSNNLGEKVELVEYEPFGKFSRQEKYGSTEDVARFYFTGQRYDDDTELYYYNARYYDPGLGRFISADTVVQAPGYPQTFNRYSYTSNNPINRIDPTGHFWGELFATIFAFIFTAAVDNAIVSAVTNDWGSFSDRFEGSLVSLASSALFSWGNIGAITSSYLSMQILSTEPGRQSVNWFSEQILDDALGFTPKTAHLLGYMISSAVVTSAIYIGMTPEDYIGPDYQNSRNQENGIKNYAKGDGKPGPGGSTTSQIADSGGKARWLEQGRIASEHGWADKFLGKITKALGINHTVAVVHTPNGFFDSAFDNNLINPFVQGNLWGTPWTGICQQVCFTTLVEKGGASGWQAFNAVGQSSGWSYYATSAIYGVRADFGGVGLIQGATNTDYKN